MRQAGRYLPEFREIRSKNTDFIKLCLNENLSSEITLQPLRRFSLDAAIIFSDILMLPFGLNQKVDFKKDFGPQLGNLNLEEMSKLDEIDFIEKLYFANDLLSTPQADGHDQSSAIAQDLVANRFAWVSDRVAGKFLPQVLGLHEAGAVDFDKGCYLGQEIIARAQFRGAVKRGIDIFKWRGQAPKAGDDWKDSAHGKGTVVFAAATTNDDSGQGLWVRGL